MRHSAGLDELTLNGLSNAFWVERPQCHTSISSVKSWWRHQIETFSALLAFCGGIHWSPVNSPHEGQWRGALMFSLISTLDKRLRKSSRRRWFETPSRSYDVTIITLSPLLFLKLKNKDFTYLASSSSIEIYHTISFRLYVVIFENIHIISDSTASHILVKTVH